MRSLILFFVKYNAFFLFLILEFLCFILIFQNKQFHRSNFINSANFIAGNINNSINLFNEYLNLRSVNIDLAEENAKLRARENTSKEGLTSKSSFIIDTLNNQEYSFEAAKVIKNSVHKVNNYLTINKGSDNNIGPKMGVICANGVVGIVKDVSNNFSTVLSLLHRNIRLSGKLLKNEYFGTVYWDGQDQHTLLFTDIPQHVKLAKGDTVCTSGYSSIFPENMLIGTIKDFHIERGDNFYTISITPVTNFQKLHFVYVINNMMKIEQSKLEESNIENE